MNYMCMCLFLFANALAAPDYSQYQPTNPPQPMPPKYQPGVPINVMVDCEKGEIRHIDGKCTRPEVSKSVYVYHAPEKEVADLPAPEVPPPKIEVDIVFVKAPEALEEADPIVVPPPQKKTLVYVLSKKQEAEGQQVIEVAAPPKQKPEVFYVNYNEGENLELPGGISLQDALKSASKSGEEIDGAAKDGADGGSEGGHTGNGEGANGGYGAPAQTPAPSMEYGTSDGIDFSLFG